MPGQFRRNTDHSMIVYWRLCVILAAVAGATRGWDVGNGLKYKLTTTLLFSEAALSKSSGDVGFQLTGDLNVIAIWQEPTDHDTFLLRIEVRDLFNEKEINFLSTDASDCCDTVRRLWLINPGRKTVLANHYE